jgi:hypothetical protein
MLPNNSLKITGDLKSNIIIFRIILQSKYLIHI